MITREMFQSLQPGVAALTNQINANKRAQQEAELRKYLQAREPELAGQKQAAQNKANLDTLNDPALQSQVNNGGMAKVGDLTVGADPYAHMIAAGEKGEEAARQKAIQNYNKSLPKLQQQFQAANEGLSFVNDPKNIGSVGQAKTLMLKAMGMNRFNEDEARAVLPSTLHQAVSTFFNSGGGDNNPMDANQQAMVNQFFRSQIHNVKQQHDLLRQSSLDTYDSSRYAAPTGHQTLQNKLGGGFSQALDSADKQYSQVPATQGPSLSNQSVSPSILQQAIAAGKRGLGSVFGGGSQQAPAAQPQSAGGPPVDEQAEFIKKYMAAKQAAKQVPNGQ